MKPPPRNRRPRLLPYLVLLLVAWGLPQDALAYIGPGAGFAFAGSLLVLVSTFVLAIGTILLWPILFAWRRVRQGDPYKHAKVKRVVIVGLDGMDPEILQECMDKGRMPFFSELAAKGSFRPLRTSLPSMSPVAWSSFSTGEDPSEHGIFDFLTRDPCTYAPVLSSTEIGEAKRVLNIGKYMVPLGKAPMSLLKKGETFWKKLGEKHIFSTIQRVPITFPPEKFNGHLLSGMCVPDLRGSQGTFSFFSTHEDVQEHTGGEQSLLRPMRRQKGVFRGRIVGPNNTLRKDEDRMILPFSVKANAEGATLAIEGHEEVALKLSEYSDWVRLEFSAGLGIKVRGIVRFYLSAVDPDVQLYMTPIHIDPENPAMPISHPETYSVYLAKTLGPFATLGLAEDTWALNEGVIDEKAFYEQAMGICDERESMLKHALEHTPKGLVTTVFDTTDRISHMFYRYRDPQHPANQGRDTEAWAGTIEKVYAHMDSLLRKMRPLLDNEDTALIIMSDHGFTNFTRGVNLNTWLYQEGYLHLKEGCTTSGDWFADVDWSRTKAFALGLTGVFINRKGREASGIVAEGEEYNALKDELIEKLGALVDTEHARPAIRRVFAAEDHYEGPERFNAPDLLIGYEKGFRHSWKCATGAVTETVFSDNTKAWSGDHCVDPDLVPGIFLSNRPIGLDDPHIQDIAPTVMTLFGQKPTEKMVGRDLFGNSTAKAGNG